MSSRLLTTWFSVASALLVLAGVFFAFFGLGALRVSKDVFPQFENAMYGALMIGWGTTLLLAGRLAFRRKDAELLTILLAGLTGWLIVDSLFSLYFGVFSNVGVNVAMFVVFGFPLVKAIRERRRADKAGCGTG
jgi:hypothetical protein